MTTLGMLAALPAVHAVEPAAESRVVVVGVDTHKDVHVAAVLDHLGGLLSSGEFPATAAGYRHLLNWARQCGTVLRAGVECTDSYVPPAVSSVRTRGHLARRAAHRAIFLRIPQVCVRFAHGGPTVVP